jgi:hypothetical protein
VIFQDGAAFAAGPNPLTPAASTDNAAIEPGTSFYIRGYGNGSDKGIRETWLPLFDRYGVDLVLCGHDHDYERSWPVRGCNHDAGRDAATGAPVDTLQPSPVVTLAPADGAFDSGRGTIHLILGGGGTSAPLDVYGVDAANGKPQAKVFTKPNRPVPGALFDTIVLAKRRRD